MTFQRSLSKTLSVKSEVKNKQYLICFFLTFITKSPTPFSSRSSFSLIVLLLMSHLQKTRTAHYLHIPCYFQCQPKFDVPYAVPICLCTFLKKSPAAHPHSHLPCTFSHLSSARHSRQSIYPPAMPTHFLAQWEKRFWKADSSPGLSMAQDSLP